jgi:hypothetical protein
MKMECGYITHREKHTEAQIAFDEECILRYKCFYLHTHKCLPFVIEKAHRASSCLDKLRDTTPNSASLKMTLTPRGF